MCKYMKVYTPKETFIFGLAGHEDLGKFLILMLPCLTFIKLFSTIGTIWNTYQQ